MNRMAQSRVLLIGYAWRQREREVHVSHGDLHYLDHATMTAATVARHINAISAKAG